MKLSSKLFSNNSKDRGDTFLLISKLFIMHLINIRAVIYQIISSDDASSHHISVYSSIYNTGSKSTQKSLMILFLHLLKLLQQLGGKLALHICIYYISFSTGVQSKVKPPRNQEMADLGQEHNCHLCHITTSPSKCFPLLSLTHFLTCPLQKSYSQKNIRTLIPTTLSLLP